jgi:hypothetical protein
MMTYITGSKPEYPWDKGCQEIEKYRMAILDDDVFFHITLILKTKNRSNPLSDYCDYISCYFTSLPQIYLVLIISVLHSYGTKMFPQFE